MNIEITPFFQTDVAWIGIAFCLGLLSKSVRLPALVGFLIAGFVLNALGASSGVTLQKISDLGITLLLFTVGLKLDLRTLARKDVWAVTGLHATMTVIVLSVALYGLALWGLLGSFSLDWSQALLIAFALSFSSTVFVVKALEQSGEMASLHGRVAIGILIMQDILAVGFLTLSTGAWPSIWALGIVLLIPLRPVLHNFLVRTGHGELLILYGFFLAMGGTALFESVGLKGDLGALAFGVLISGHDKSDEMAKAMLRFKDILLLGFFLSIGLSGSVTWETFWVAVLLVPFVFMKSGLFFMLLTRFRLRARTSLLASINLSNYSEFGLIVAAVAVSGSWISDDWMIVMAIAVSLSFVVAATMDTYSQTLYTRHQVFWKRWEAREFVEDDRLIDFADARIAIIGMGGVGTGAYDKMREQYGHQVVGVDIDPMTVKNHADTGRHVLCGDPSDVDFWDRMQATHTLEMVMLALPKSVTNIEVIEQLLACGFDGTIAATVKFEDEAQALKEAGATTVFNIYSEAGSGFAAHVNEQI